MQFFCVLIWSSFSLLAMASGHALLVLDAANNPNLPRHFRMSIPLTNTKEINWQGFKELQMIGSAQFSNLSLEKALEKIPTTQIMIIDLRQESHGLLNANAISWYGPQNADNSGKSFIQIKSDEDQHLAKLSQLEKAWVHEILSKNSDGTLGRTKAKAFIVQQVVDEASLVMGHNLKYYRLYVQDFHAPEDAVVDEFLQLIRHVDKKEWLYFHCRAGVGRTTIFMNMLDMLRNAKKVSYEDIMARQKAIGGKDMTHIPKPTSFKYESAVQRLKFLGEFYQYAKDSDGGRNFTWSEWKHSKKK